MANYCTPRQTACIWRFCAKHGSGGHESTFWINLSKRGVIDKFSAMKLISEIKDFQKDPTPKGKKTVEILFRQYIPDFRVVSDPFPNGQEEVPEGKPEEEGSGDSPESPGVPQGPVEPQPGSADKVKDMLKSLEKELEKKIKPKKGTGIPEDFVVSEDYIPPPEFPTILALLRLGVNVLITGPAGAGKSRLARELAVATQSTLHPTVTMGGSMRYPQVFGSSKLTIREGIQVSEFEAAQLLQNVQKPGIQVIDEIFSCEGDVTNGLNGLLEPSTRAISTPGGIVEMHPDCHLVATANTNGRSLSNMYTGVNIQDFSLLDRFVEIRMGYNTGVEDKLLERLEDPGTEEWIRSRLKTLRDKIEENNIQFEASTRKLLTCIKMVVGGLGAEMAFELSFLNQLSKSERIKVGL